MYIGSGVTRGYAKHPCKQIKYSQRVAVRPIRPYGCIRIGTQREPLYILKYALKVALYTFK